MEEINGLLQNNEEILWKFSKKEDPLSKPRKNVKTGLILTFFITILELFYVISGIFIKMVPEIIMPIALLLSFILLFLILSINDYKKVLKKFELSPEELKNYENVYILTNKRWIQKSINVFNIDFSKLHKQNLKRNKDIVLVSLEILPILYTYDLGEKYGYYVIFLQEYDKNSIIDPLENLGLIIPSENYWKFNKAIQEFFTLDKKEQDINVKIFHLK